MFKIYREQVTVWLYRNFKILLGLLILCTVIALSLTVYNKIRRDKEIKAKDNLLSFQKALNDLRGEPKKKTELFNLNSREKDNLIFTDQMKIQAQAYRKAIEEHKNFKITLYFVIDLADFYYRYGQKDLAKELLSGFSFPLEKNTFNQMVSFQLASYYMNEKDCDKSLSLFEKLISNKFAKAFHVESRLQKGICLEHLNRPKEALTEYNRVSIENADSYLGRQAKDYKNLLILKQKLKEK
ncbi:MAG: tetratricopeptide repeat protein [Bdellovibrionales bacterium]|nr:tetratricopeptide repeat protein [Bdellovibrionales bacterium]